MVVSVNKPRLLRLHLFTSNTSSTSPACLKQRCTRPTAVWPLLPLTKWVMVCFQMSDCSRTAERLSLRQRGNPDVATHSAFQQQTLGDTLSCRCFHWLVFTVYNPLAPTERCHLTFHLWCDASTARQKPSLFWEKDLRKEWSTIGAAEWAIKGWNESRWAISIDHLWRAPSEAELMLW